MSRLKPINYDAVDRVFEYAVQNIIDVWPLAHSRQFAQAVELLSTHRCWVVGMGKAGHLAEKFASTLASNGRPAAYIHAGEALHGGFGAVQKGDLLVAISNSGKTDEVVCVTGKARDRGAKVIVISGHSKTKMSLEANVLLCYGKIAEACPLGLTPTTSIITILALCDALSIAVQTRIGTTISQYATNHHAGYLGKLARKGSRNCG